MTPTRPMGVVIIGCGAVTQDMYAMHLPQIKGLRVVMVSDLRQDNAQKVAGLFNCRTSTAIEAIAAAQLVMIATPPAAHGLLTRQALAAGKDVWVEKPFTTASGEAKELVALAAASGRRLFVAQFRRLYPKVALTREIVSSGLLGPVRSIIMHEGGRFDWEVTSDYVSRDPHGGVLFDTGAHTLDMGLFAAGMDEKEVQVQVLDVKRDRPEPAHEFDGRFILRGSDVDIEGRLHLSRIGRLANCIRIVGEHGMVEFDVSHDGGVRIAKGDHRFQVYPEKQVMSARHAFTLQFHRLLTAPDELPLAGRSFLNQVTVLEALHSHV